MLDGFFEGYKMTKEGKGTYTGTGGSNEYALMSIAIGALQKAELFMDNVKLWKCYYPNPLMPGGMCCDDVLKDVVSDYEGVKE